MENFTLTYSLRWHRTGAPVDDINYSNLDQARDVAFGYSEESGMLVMVIEHFGQSENLVETVIA